MTRTVKGAAFVVGAAVAALQVATSVAQTAAPSAPGPVVLDPSTLPPAQPVTLQALPASATAAAAPAAPTGSAVGRTPGTFAVSPAGNATYSIPLWNPPGPAGMQPTLTLNYDSGIPDGLMGPGWSLGGFSIIARCEKTVAQDPTPAPVTLTSSDRFCLDGNRLRLFSGSTYGADGAQYQTEIADFSLVISHGTAGGGPAWFEVYRKDGLIYEYGNINTGTVADSRILAQGSTTPYIWALNKVRDRLGNFMTYTYAQTNGAYVPTQVQYTTTPGNAQTAHYAIDFFYSTRVASDNLSKYVAASQVLQTNQISSIAVFNDLTVVRQYNLTYTASATTYRPTLTAIQECSATQCFAPTAVAYQAAPAGVSSPTTASGSGATTGAVRIADFDGDGRADLLFATQSGSSLNWWVQFSTGSGYGAPVSTGAVTPVGANVLPDDFLGIGRAQFLAPNGPTWFLYAWNGSAFTATSTGSAVDTGLGPGQAATADTDGDGLPDLVTVVGAIPYTVYIRKNTSSNGVVSFAAPSTALTGSSISMAPQIFGNYAFTNSSVTHMDFDGDGRDDILLAYQTIQNFVLTPMIRELPSLGATLDGTGPANAAALSVGVAPARWNDDACTDIIMSTQVYIAACKGGTTATLVHITTTGTGVLALDWDGDGRTDYLSNVGGVWQVYRSQGTSAATGVSTGLSATAGGQFVMDTDGDGLDDLGLVSSSSHAIFFGLHIGAGTPPDVATSIADGFGVTYSPAYSTLASPAVYTRGTGAPAGELDYIGPYRVVSSYTASNGTGGSGVTYSVSEFYNTARLSLTGRGFEGFASKREFENRSPTYQLYRYDYYGQSFPFTALPLGHSLLQADNATAIELRTNTYPSVASITLDNSANNQRYFPYIQSHVVSAYEVGGPLNGTEVKRTTTTYAYAGAQGLKYGNPSQITTQTVDKDPTSSPPWNGQTFTDTVSITPSEVGWTGGTNNWCIHLPGAVSEQRTSPVSTPASQTQSMSYTVTTDGSCRVTAQTQEPTDLSLQVATSFGYDSCGNLSSVQVIGQNPDHSAMAPRLTTFGYGTACIVPETISRNVDGTFLETTTVGYQYTLGLPTSVTAPTGAQTTWTYNDIGQETLEQRPDGTQSALVRTACTSPSYCGDPALRYSLERDEKDATVNHTTFWLTQQYFDLLDRIRIDRPQQSNGAQATVATSYDAAGRVVSKTNPSGNGFPSATTTISYDVLNRPLAVVRPPNTFVQTPQTTTYGYSGRSSTVTDPLGHVITRIVDALGELGIVIDPDGTSQTTFGYDPFGHRVSIVDAENNLATRSYDAKGYVLTATSDRDRGSWSYEYDSLGDLLHVRDARTTAPGWTQVYSYDRLGRVLTRTDVPEGNALTTWQWGKTLANHDVGQLISLSGPVDSETYGYDSIGRVATHTTAYAPSGPPTSYVFGYAYNTIGALDTLTYPLDAGQANRFAVQYGYTNGFVAQVQDVTPNGTNTVFWKLTPAVVNMDPWGNVIDETLGTTAAARIASVYDAATGWLSTRQVGSGGSGNNLQSLAYGWDAAGNLLQRADLHQLPTVTEAFGSYDALSRPTASTLNGVGNLSVTYSKSGNIATRTDPALLPSSLATYRYDAVHPHAVASVSDGTTTLAYQYDANGNLSTRTLGGVPYAVSWSSYNRPTSIAGPGVQSAFTYGADRERIYESSSYVGASGPETTIFIGGLYEVETTPVPQTHFKHFVPVPGGTTIVHDLQSVGGVQTTYITADHLGSGTLLLDHTGTPLITESYAAFGYRRNSNWSGALAAASPDYATIAGTTRRGYTGAFHEMLDNLDLIHMNGRVYDPTIARFMSPDPVLDPLNDADSQSWNPYSYTANRPLTYFDPTGEFTVCFPFIAISGNGGDGGDYYDGWGGTIAGLLGGVDVTVGFTCGDVPAGGRMQYGTDHRENPAATARRNPCAADPLGCSLRLRLRARPQPYHTTADRCTAKDYAVGIKHASAQSQKPNSCSNRGPAPSVSLTAQQGIYAAFSAQLTKVIGFDLDLNLGSYNTPSSGSPYMSHGISVVLNVGPVKVGGSWEQTSYNGGLSFESSPSNFIVGSLQASSEGLSLAFKPPQAFSGFQTQLNNPQSLLPTSDTPCTP